MDGSTDTQKVAIKQMTTYASISRAITLSASLGPFIILNKSRINVTDKMTKVIFVASVRKSMSLFSSGDVVVMVLVIQASNPYRQTDFARYDPNCRGTDFTVFQVPNI